MDPQIFIDKLRAGHYAEAISMVTNVYKIYSPYFNNDVDVETLLPLLVYELAKTNINQDDIVHLNNLYLLLHDKSLLGNELEYIFHHYITSICELFSLQDENKLQLFTKYTLDSKENIQSFLNEYLRCSRKLPNDYQNQICSLQREIQTVIKDIQQNNIEAPVSYSLFELENCELLKNTVSEYKVELGRQITQLLTEAEKQNIPSLAEAASPLTKLMILTQHLELGRKATRLANRFKAVCNLENKLIGQVIITDQLRNQVKLTVESCKNNQPTWLERNLLDKLIDIISLGIKPLLRYFFFKDGEHQQIDDMKKFSEKGYPSAKLL